jgi:hypothetical protein
MDCKASTAQPTPASLCRAELALGVGRAWHAPCRREGFMLWPGTTASGSAMKRSSVVETAPVKAGLPHPHAVRYAGLSASGERAGPHQVSVPAPRARSDRQIANRPTKAAAQ